MTKATQQKASRIDDKYTKQMWEDFQKLAVENYDIKSSSEETVFIKIPKVEHFDIEIYPGYGIRTHKFSINVWDNRKGNKRIDKKEVDSLRSLIIHIDKYIKMVQEKLKYNLL